MLQGLKCVASSMRSLILAEEDSLMMNDVRQLRTDQRVRFVRMSSATRHDEWVTAPNNNRSS
jgi:hypothetical protein